MILNVLCVNIIYPITDKKALLKDVFANFVAKRLANNKFYERF